MRQAVSAAEHHHSPLPTSSYYRVAWNLWMPHLHRLFPAKEPCNHQHDTHYTNQSLHNCDGRATEDGAGEEIVVTPLHMILCLVLGVLYVCVYVFLAYVHICCADVFFVFTYFFSFSSAWSNACMCIRIFCVCTYFLCLVCNGVTTFSANDTLSSAWGNVCMCVRVFLMYVCAYVFFAYVRIFCLYVFFVCALFFLCLVLGAMYVCVYVFCACVRICCVYVFFVRTFFFLKSIAWGNVCMCAQLFGLCTYFLCVRIFCVYVFFFCV